ncbi:MAG: TolC family protein [Planctomycetota bacterium]
MARDRWRNLLVGILVALVANATSRPALAAEIETTESVPATVPLPQEQSLQPADPSQPTLDVLPISLPTSLQLAGVNPLDIGIANESLRVAYAQLEKASVLWLPNISVGMEYFRHDGQIQDVGGRVFTTSRSSLLVGAGPNAVFAMADAIYSPLASRQIVRARQANVQAARNDSLYAVAEAYFNVQQARGQVAGAAEVVRRAEDLVARVEKLTPGLAPRVEVNRARTELERRRQSVELAYEGWQVSSAELIRILRLDPKTVVEPVEPPHTRVSLIDLKQPVDLLIPVGLTNRPELASQQALVQATLVRLRQERIRPLIPSILLRGNATNPGGTLSSGYFGGGINDDMTNFGARNSYDAQVIWELQNLGFGNRANVRERSAENRRAMLELFRLQDRVAADVSQALAQAQRATARIREAESELQNAVETADKNLEGMQQTKRAGELLVLVFRPQEVVAAIAAMAQAYNDFYSAIADANRAQFRLYWALGNPAQALTSEGATDGCLFITSPTDRAASARPAKIDSSQSNVEN